MKIFQLIAQFLPDVMELIQFFCTVGEEEFESISKTWPAPIKTKLARLRFEAKLIEEFPTTGED